MNQLQVFKNDMFGEVRSVVISEDPYLVGLVGKDVAEILEYNEPNKAIVRHVDEDDRMKRPITDNLGRVQEMWVVNESGLFALILGSKLPNAKLFKKWVTSEVLPTIRKTGGYVANDDMFIETYLPHADEGTKLMFRATLENVRRANERIRVMQPKADYFDALVERNLLTNFRDTAKELQVKEREFIGWLLERGYLYRDGKGKLKPYAQYVPGLFELKEWERNGKADNQTLVTPKGRETFRLLLASATAV